MFDCSDDVLAYHDQMVTLPQAERNAMRERRDANRERLKTRLRDTEKPTPSKFIKQGSYAMHTMVQDSQNDYDIDDGIYFTQESLRDKNGADMAANSARKMVCEALKDARFSRQPEVRNCCVRIYYNEGYHVDMPVYRIRAGDGEYELASGDAWIVSRAADVEEWFSDMNDEKSPDDVNGGQFRRVTRALKKFARSRNAWKPQTATGFTITKLVAERYVSDVEREDVAVRNTMQAVYARLSLSLEVDHPVTPAAKLTTGPQDSKTAHFRDRLEELLKELEVLDDANCTRSAALAAWDRVFNTSFFSERAVRKAAAYGTAPAIITNPPNPWVR